MSKYFFQLFFVLMFFTKPLLSQDSLRSYYSKSLDAYNQKEYSEFLKYAKKADDLRPNHPILAYNIAAAYALNGDHKKAISALNSYLMMNASTEYTEDLDFASLKNEPGFQQLEKLVTALQERIIGSDEAFRLNQEKDHFESISYHSNDDAFLLGTVTTRSLFKIKNGQKTTIISSNENNKVFGVMGIDVNEDLIWVCTAALPEINSYSDSIKNKSSVFGLSTISGKVLFEYIVPEAILGDIISYENGKAIASDGLSNKLYIIDKNGVEVLADLSKDIINLQGISLYKNTLFLSDYITGLYQFDLNNKKLSKIQSKGLYAEKGIDGLLFYNKKLICFQNGTTPKRVFSIVIKENQAKEIKVIDQNLYNQGEPTQGVIVGDHLYYISNSAWDSYTDGRYEGAPEVDVRKISW
ncbi:MAG: hypothetical protein RIC35_14550 [Marinoscillum sp.]